MRVLEINKFYFPKRGADRHFFDVINLLEKKGHDVAVFSMHHSQNLDSPWKKYFLSTVGYTSEFTLWQKLKGVFRMFYSFEANNKINALLEEFKPDVVHIHNIYHQLSPAILFQIKKRGIPIIMTVHDYKLVCPDHGLFQSGKIYDRCRNGKFYQCLIDKCVKNSYAKSLLAMLEAYWHAWLKTYENVDLFISPSEFTKSILTERGVEPNKIVVVPHFLSEEWSFKCLEKNDEGNCNMKGYGLYIGALTKDKGVETLVSIFSKLPESRLKMAGSIEEGINEPNMENVEYIGYLNRANLRDVIASSKYVISTSKLPETFGLIAMEAISLGKPFFGFYSGGYREIIENGFNGNLFEGQEDLKAMIEEIENGRKYFNSDLIRRDALKKYSAKKYYEVLMSVFSKASIG